LALVGFLAFWSLVEQRATIIQPLLGLLQGLPEAVRQGPKEYRVLMWTLAFNIFFMIQLFFVMLLVLMVGPDLISKDLRFNALPLYLSRPLHRFDYFLGKWGVIAFYLTAVTAGPVIIGYLLAVALSLDATIVRDTWRVLVGALVWSIVVMLSSGTLMLAISSLSRNSRYVSIIFAAFWLVLSTASGAVWSTQRPDEAGQRPEWPRLISYTNNLWRIGEVCIDTESAWNQWDKLVEGFRAQTAQMERQAFGLRPSGRGGGRTNEARFSDRTGRPNDRGSEQRQAFRQTFPWTWSAALLSGLFVFSVLILATRVRSLDRLK
jgi:ABC-2 type transport system permease protein